MPGGCPSNELGAIPTPRADDGTRFRRFLYTPGSATIVDQSLIAFQKADCPLKIVTAFWALKADHIRVEIRHRTSGDLPSDFLIKSYIELPESLGMKLCRQKRTDKHNRHDCQHQIRYSRLRNLAE